MVATNVEPIYKAVGERIRKARSEYNWTQADLANEVGLSRATIANIELGKARFSLHVLSDIANLFEIPARELFPTKTEVKRVIRDKIKALEKDLKRV